MPTCPGCQQRISHTQLHSHERKCIQLDRGDAVSAAVCRVEERVDRLERRFEERLSQLESHVQTETSGVVTDQPEGERGPLETRQPEGR